ncbi:MAG: phosphate acyltransferase PlsX [Candidatus Thiodiazotropha sp.]
MSKPVTISLDAMGGDFGADVVVPAALEYLKRDKESRLILVGREEILREKIGSHPFGDRLISAGNTGALMATSRFVLKMLPNIDRPAIITAIPSIEGQTYVLDLGANVDCTASHLFQFAVMGSEQVSAVAEIANPRIGLLNIGQEEIKGNEQVKGAHELLANSSLNYVGYVEGDDIFKGGTDVVVADGFVGNTSLKSVEGVSKMISHFMKQEFKKNPLTMLAGLVALPVLRSLRKRIDPRRYNGASLLGLRGIVIKSHGGADVLAFVNAISIAKKEVLTDVPSRIAEQVKAHLDKREIA